MKKLELKIGSPCTENWDTFEKRGLNGFCSSCQKEVVDFTKMSDRQIQDYFLKFKGDVCGRMRNNQQKAYPIVKESNLNPLLHSLIAVSSLLFSTMPALSQIRDKTEITSKKREVRSSANLKTSVSGTVFDDTGAALPGAIVVIKGTTRGTTTDIDGRYTIEVSSEDILEFSFIGFESVKVEVSKRETIDVTLDGVLLLGEVVYLGAVDSRWYTPRGLWWRVKGFFARIF